LAELEVSLGELVQEAVASPPNERVERYRDRLASFGDDVVRPLLTLEREQPSLGLFVTVVLERAAHTGADEARIGLDMLASLGKDLATRRAARDARSRTGGRRVPQEDVPNVEVTRIRPRSPAETIQLINAARERRGEPTLDAAEAGQVIANLERRAADPDRYRSVCWKCSAAVDAATNERCEFCQWLVCWCGGCRAPNYRDRRTGETGHCRREVWLSIREREDAQEVVDLDYRGVPILTAGPPASDEAATVSTLVSHGIRAVFHWTPLRNLRSILMRGLLSRATLARRRIPIVAHGYGSIEKEKALRDYVCVSLEPKPWMMSAWSETPLVLEVDPAPLGSEGTLFVPGNSASMVFDIDGLLAMQGTPSVEKMFRSGSLAPQAEAWIPMAVPRIAIRAIHAKDVSTAKSVHASGVLADLPHPPQVRVTPEFFLADPLESPA
jgi:hypothetical protein